MSDDERTARALPFLRAAVEALEAGDGERHEACLAEVAAALGIPLRVLKREILRWAWETNPEKNHRRN